MSINNKGTNLKLKKDIEYLLTHKLKNIKCVDEILENNGFVISTLENPNHCYSFSQLYEFKKYLQLILNIYNDFEMFKSLKIKFHPIKDKFTKDSIQGFYHYNPSDDKWECFGRPCKSDVISAVYNYVICFLSLKQINENKNEVISIEKALIDCCPFCESEVIGGMNNCPVCGASIEEMLNDMTTKNVVEIIEGEGDIVMKNENNSRDDRSESILNVESRNVNECHKKIDSQVNSKEIDNMESRVVIKDPLQTGIVETDSVMMGPEMNTSIDEVQDRIVLVTNERTDSGGEVSGSDGNVAYTWACPSCGFVNMEEYLTCAVCSVTRKYCKHGSLRESCDLCKLMSHGASALCPDNEHSRKDQWQCSKCDVWLSYSCIVCSKCGVDRTVGGGRWVCDKCTLINQCLVSRCGACNNINNHLVVVRYCKNCPRKRVSGTEDYCDECMRYRTYPSMKWMCKFGNCKAWNDKHTQYCGVCNRWKFSSHIRGEPVRVRSRDGEFNVWICERCHRDNDLTISMCSHPHCGGTRYKAQYCHLCREMNNGSSYYCNSCHTRL